MERSLPEISNFDFEVLNEEWENYFANTIIPQLFVDGNLYLRKFTPPAMKQFNLSPADINRKIIDVADNFRYTTFIDNINEVIATGKILEKEVQTTDKRWYQMNILPYITRKDNKTNGVIITFVDITDRIAVLKDLEQINAEHNTLLYTLSHDVRQPLSTIALLADELLETFNSRDSAQMDLWIEMLQRAAENMKRLMEDFTAHINLESTLPMKDERINIEEVLAEVLLALKNEIFGNSIQIIQDINASEVIFPRKNLRSVVFNLLNNAIKYQRNDEPQVIKIKTWKEPGYVVFSVKDNGLGIDKKYHKLIFEKYSRLNDQIEGTGMGLYIINKMLAEKGGKIEVESTPGIGSTFSVYFKTDY